jgi:hypothetical protein
MPGQCPLKLQKAKRKKLWKTNMGVGEQELGLWSLDFHFMRVQVSASQKEAPKTQCQTCLYSLFCIPPPLPNQCLADLGYTFRKAQNIRNPTKQFKIKRTNKKMVSDIIWSRKISAIEKPHCFLYEMYNSLILSNSFTIQYGIIYVSWSKVDFLNGHFSGL